MRNIHGINDPTGRRPNDNFSAKFGHYFQEREPNGDVRYRFGATGTALANLEFPSARTIRPN